MRAARAPVKRFVPENPGGPTQTMALLPGSPAIDAGSNALAVDPSTGQPLTTDQRGLPRIANGTVDIGAVEFQGPFLTPNQRYVTHLYQDLLDRVPDPGGLAFWAGMLDQGMSTYQVALAIENSPEHHVLEVRQLYERLLRREPDPGGLMAWVNFLNQGDSEQAPEAQFLGSAEYFSRIGGGTATGFLQALYGDVLGRPLDPVRAQGWGGWLAQGLSPAAVAATVLSSPESDFDTVEGLYQQYLHRPTDPGGLFVFAEALQRGLSYEAATALLLGSPEYYQNAV